MTNQEIQDYLKSILGDSYNTQSDPDIYNQANWFTTRHYTRFGTRRYSDANPFGRQIPLSASDSELESLRSSAAQWESDYQNYLINREDALADRAHDEQYNDPSSQASRLRAAGINPDLGDAVSSSSTESNTPVQSPTQSEMSEDNRLENSISLAQTVLGGTAQLGNLALESIDFIQGLPLKTSQLEGLNLLNAGQAQQNFLDSVPFALSASESALGLAGDNPFSIDHVRQSLSGTPYADNTDFQNFVYTLASSPQAKSRLVSQLNQLDDSLALRDYRNKLNFSRVFSEKSLNFQLLQLDSNYAREFNEHSYQLALSSLGGPSIQAQSEVDNFLNVSDTRNANVANDVFNKRAVLESDNTQTVLNRNKQLRTQIQDSLTQRNRAIQNVINMIKDVDNQISSLTPDPETGLLNEKDRTTLMALKMYRQQMYMYGAEEWKSTLSSYKQFLYTYSINSASNDPTLLNRMSSFLPFNLDNSEHMDLINASFEERFKLGDSFDFEKLFQFLPF